MAQFVERLGRTLGWLELERPLALVEGAVVRRSRLLHDELCAADVQGAFARWLLERDALLPPGRGPVGFVQGRVLLLLTDFNLHDGSAWLASGGLFDELNVPWCDLWVDYVEVGVQIGARGVRTPALAAWIPCAFEPHAQAAIDVSPEECLGWADLLVPDWPAGTNA